MEKQAFGLEGIAKINLRITRISHNSRVHFSVRRRHTVFLEKVRKLDVELLLSLSYGLRPLPSAPRPLHSRIADSRHCCKRILAFFGTSTCHLRIFGLFGTLGSITKDTLRSRLGFLLISGGFCCPWLLFGGFVPLLWHPGGPWEDPGTILGRSWDIGGHKEGPCEVQAWILSIFC